MNALRYRPGGPTDLLLYINSLKRKAAGANVAARAVGRLRETPLCHIGEFARTREETHAGPRRLPVRRRPGRVPMAALLAVALAAGIVTVSAPHVMAMLSAGQQTGRARYRGQSGRARRRGQPGTPLRVPGTVRGPWGKGGRGHGCPALGALPGRDAGQAGATPAGPLRTELRDHRARAPADRGRAGHPVPAHRPGRRDTSGLRLHDGQRGKPRGLRASDDPEPGHGEAVGL